MNVKRNILCVQNISLRMHIWITKDGTLQQNDKPRLMVCQGLAIHSSSFSSGTFGKVVLRTDLLNGTHFRQTYPQWLV